MFSHNLFFLLLVISSLGKYFLILLTNFPAVQKKKFDKETWGLEPYKEMIKTKGRD